MLTRRVCICVCVSAFRSLSLSPSLPTSWCCMCMGIREFNPLPIFSMPVCLFVVLEFTLSQVRGNFTFTVFLCRRYPSVCVRIVYIEIHLISLKRVSSQMDRFLSLRRAYQKPILRRLHHVHTLYRLLRTIQCTSTRFLLFLSSLLSFLSAWLFVWFWCFHFFGGLLLDPTCVRLRTCVFMCDMYLFIHIHMTFFRPAFFHLLHNFRFSFWFYYRFSAVNWMICESFLFRISNTNRLFFAQQTILHLCCSLNWIIMMNFIRLKHFSVYLLIISIHCQEKKFYICFLSPT